MGRGLSTCLSCVHFDLSCPCVGGLLCCPMSPQGPDKGHQVLVHPSPLGPSHILSSGVDQMGFLISMCPPHLLSDGKEVTSTWAQGEEIGAGALEGVKVQIPPRSRRWTEAVILKLGGMPAQSGPSWEP